MIMKTPKTMSRATSNAARRMMSRRWSGVVRPACPSRRTKFSTVTTEASTINQKSSTPNDMRFDESRSNTSARRR